MFDDQPLPGDAQRAASPPPSSDVNVELIDDEDDLITDYAFSVGLGALIYDLVFR